MTTSTTTTNIDQQEEATEKAKLERLGALELEDENLRQARVALQTDWQRYQEVKAKGRQTARIQAALAFYQTGWYEPIVLQTGDDGGATTITTTLEEVLDSATKEKHQPAGSNKEKRREQKSSQKRAWKILQDQGHTAAQHHILRRLLTTPWTVCCELFLPIGFPTSVRDGYLEYQLYDSLQGLCSYLRGVLCNAQVLQAAGVGNAEATAWGAALAWAQRDGLGLLGGLAFSYAAAPHFDAHVKEFRLFADLINDVALTLDMTAPYFTGRALLGVMGASTLCKTLCGMSAAATKAHITVYFATEGNMADLNAKEATQETLVTLLGMLCGVALAQWLQNYSQGTVRHDDEIDWTERIQWGTFIVLTLVHIWANWQGVCILRLNTLNRERAEHALEPLVSAVLQYEQMDHETAYRQVQLPSPLQVNESLIVSTRKMIFPGKLCLKANLSDMLQSDQPTLQYLDSWFVDGPQAAARDCQYLVTANYPRGRVQACLFAHATRAHELQAFCHALLLARGLAQQKNSTDWQSLSLHYGGIVEAWFRPGRSDSLPQRLSDLGWDVTGRLYLGFPHATTRATLVFKEE